MTIYAVIGSRNYSDLDRVAQWCIDNITAQDVIVSGGARGVDTTAKASAKVLGCGYIEFLPDYSTYGKRAPLERNKLIVDAADEVVAFWDGESTCTQHSVTLAKKQGKKVTIICESGLSLTVECRTTPKQ